MSKNNKPRRNHYLNIYYLNKFCDNENKLWMYDKENIDGPVHLKCTNAAVIKNFYKLEEVDDSIAYDIEKFLATEIEAPAAPLYQKLLNFNMPKNSEKSTLANYFGCLAVRTPAHFDSLKKLLNQYLSTDINFILRDKDTWIDTYKIFYPDLSNSEAEEDYKLIVSDNIKFESHKNLVLKSFLTMAHTLSLVIKEMNWFFIKTDGDLPFLTSDYPLQKIYIPFTEQVFTSGLYHKPLQLLIPISQYLCLVMVHDKPHLEGKIYDINNSQYRVHVKSLVREINRSNFCNAYKYVFAPQNSKKLERLFKNLRSAAKSIEQALGKNNTVSGL